MMQIDVVGYLAASLVFAAFWTRSMRSLRGIAIASNLAFIAYGYIGDLMPVLLLHLVLLPVNVLRLAQLGLARK
jgi:CRP/FNR family transcriptional regulator, cyclic AMP receptor protein